MLSEKKISERNKKPEPPLQVKWSVPKGIKHSEDFDEKKIKRKYLGRVIDDVDFFHEQSCAHFIFINSHVWILFFINSRLTKVGGFFRELRFPPPIKRAE